jgi:YD repeat-containing protein
MAEGDVTRWIYDPETGLLLAKEDAAGAAVTYTYGPAGRLESRTWSRANASSQSPMTFYGYDAATGELTSVDYRIGISGDDLSSTSDDADTADVAYSYL